MYRIGDGITVDRVLAAVAASQNKISDYFYSIIGDMVVITPFVWNDEDKKTAEKYGIEGIVSKNRIRTLIRKSVENGWMKEKDIKCRDYKS